MWLVLDFNLVSPSYNHLYSGAQIWRGRGSTRGQSGVLQYTCADQEHVDRKRKQSEDSNRLLFLHFPITDWG